MNPRDLPDDVARMMDDMSEAASLGVGRPPDQKPIETPPDPEPGDHHRHMPFFPMFIRDEKGDVVEVDATKIPRYECPDPDCSDPNHEHGVGHVHAGEGGGEEPAGEGHMDHGDAHAGHHEADAKPARPSSRAATSPRKSTPKTPQKGSGKRSTKPAGGR